ncbi:hypothetical protein GCM10009430_24560 [Aquimarina litoralis]|uniref:Uncharacterized protein n=1 Tax=Aquimarina litoralis TaxID=584605 RepID=A0ABN1IVN1_9FLAO
MRYLIVLLIIVFSCKEKKSKNISSIDDKTSKDIRIDTISSYKQIDTIIHTIKNDTLIFKLSDKVLYFSDKVENRWKKIQVKKLENGVITNVSTPKELSYEKSDISDFSPNQKYLLLHAIEKGELSDGNSVEEIEKYNCMFLDIQNIKLSDKYEDLFCSGEWKDQDKWMVDEEETYRLEEIFKN